ncbi:sensor histidine kinase [Jidongwangia harbinensis]|uniref:sensor histidine kinase n=1 Tax=Jidongwangia harbinensis TaxID=2878561 RepID=UPI001CDA084B|nr:sensor histidine kinase [Jidongwangia harbinensis]MCA2215202.1 sensor histidine kinase [Jidongwangia harbinensis]
MPTPPTLDDWHRPGPTARQRRIDLYIGLATVAAALANVAMARSLGLFPFGTTPGAAEQYALAFAVAAPLIWRRTHPEIALLVVAAVFIAGQVRGSQETQIASGAIFAAIYALGAWGRNRDRARWVRLVAISAMFVWLGISWLLSFDEIREQTRTDAAGPITPLLAALANGVLINILIFGFAYLFGETAWLAARRQYQLEQQAEELRAAQDQAKERAVFGERVRIARELHDVVAHHVSVMGIQASAARRALDKDVGKARTALGAVEESARTAVDELRRMLGALRASSSGPEPSAPAGLERIDEIITRVRESGLTGTLTVYGDPLPVPQSVSQAAYRIVQEAVTNTLKHARASSVDVRIRYLERELEIDVADDGRGGTAPGDGTGDGMGLIGMRERVSVHDGTVEAGPRATGGFRVRARLPVQRELAAQA